MINRQHKVTGVMKIIEEGNDIYANLDKKAQRLFDLVSPKMSVEGKKIRKRKLDHILKMDKNFGDKDVEYFDSKFLNTMYDICDIEKIRVY